MRAAGADRQELSHLLGFPAVRKGSPSWPHVAVRRVELSPLPLARLLAGVARFPALQTLFDTLPVDRCGTYHHLLVLENSISSSCCL